jgi:hypothetical protein
MKWRVVFFVLFAFSLSLFANPLTTSRGTVHGVVMGSYDGVLHPLSGATVEIVGPEDYSTTTGDDGSFQITGVADSVQYQLIVSHTGFSMYTLEFVAEPGDQDMGTITLIAGFPGFTSVTAHVRGNDVTFNWQYEQAPFFNPVGVRIIRNGQMIQEVIGANNAILNNLSNGVYSFEFAVIYQTGLSMSFPLTVTILAVDVSGFVDGTDQAGVGLTGAEITFISDENTFTATSLNGHFTLGQINGNTEYEVHITCEGYENYMTDLEVGDSDMSIGTPQAPITLAWILPPPTNVIAALDVSQMYVAITWQGPTVTYRVYRMLEGDEENPATWTLLGNTDGFEYVDTGWSTLWQGAYRWVVTAVWLNGGQSQVAFSNVLTHGGSSIIALTVDTNSGDSPLGAHVTLTNQDNNPLHVYETTLPSNGHCEMVLWGGLYDMLIEESYFWPYEAHNIAIVGDTVPVEATLIERLYPVADLTANVSPDGTTVTLTWTWPDSTRVGRTPERESSRHLLGFDVARDGSVLIHNLTDNTFEDHPGPGDHLYTVTAVLSTGISPAVTVDVFLVGQSIGAAPPADYGFAPIAPNPFNPTARLSFSLAKAGQTRIEVYDAAGRRARTLTDAWMTEGAHSLLWNGMDDAGHGCASGVYLFRLQSGVWSSTRKALLIK